MRNNDKLTVPLYTDHCSAICFTKVIMIMITKMIMMVLVTMSVILNEEKKQ